MLFDGSGLRVRVHPVRAGRCAGRGGHRRTLPPCGGDPIVNSHQLAFRLLQRTERKPCRAIILYLLEYGLMENRVFIHPGEVVSKNDGQAHFINHEKLARLYGLRPGDYIVWRGDTTDRRFMPRRSDLHLYPDYFGEYKLPPKDLPHPETGLFWPRTRRVR